MTVFFRRRSFKTTQIIKTVYSTLGKTSFYATMYLSDKDGNKLYPIDVTGKVYFYIFPEDAGGSGWSYYKNFTPSRAGIMTKREGKTGVYDATYRTLRSGSYVMFAIAEDYTVLD